MPTTGFVHACCTGRRADALAALCAHPEHDEIAALVAQWGTTEELVEFLTGNHHLLHDFGTESLSDWVRHHLWEANRLNVFDVQTPDDRGRLVANVAEQAGHEAIAGLLRDRKTTPVPRENWALPGNSPEQEQFLKACESAEVGNLREMLEHDPSLIRTRTKWGMTPVYCVGAYGCDEPAKNRESVRLLLEAGDPDPIAGLCGACWWGGDDVVFELLEAGVAVQDKAGERSALHSAAVASRFNELAKPEQFVPIVEALLRAGADPNWPDLYGWTPYAMSVGPVRQVLCKSGATEVDERPGLETFLELVENNAKGDILAAAKADPDLLRYRDRETNCSAILSALFAVDLELAKRLCAIKPIGVDLDEAAALGALDFVESAWARTPGVPEGRRWFAGEFPGRPLHLAAWFGHQEAAEFFVQKGYSPGDTNQPDVAGKYVGPKEVRDTTPLHCAAERGHRPLVALFLSKLDAHRGRA